jgi:hypothetical protein
VAYRNRENLSSRPPGQKIVQKQLSCEVIDGAPEPYGPDNPKSRVVARFVPTGFFRECVQCDNVASYKARQSKTNVYLLATVVDASGIWKEEKVYYPPECYDEAGAPYGPVYTMSPQEGIDAGLIDAKN